MGLNKQYVGITVQETASLMGFTVRHIQVLVKKGIVSGTIQKNKTGRPQWEIDLSSLPDECQVKWYKQQVPTQKTTVEVKSKGKKLDQFSASEREEIAFWFRTIEKWQEYRRQADNKTAIDEQFVAAVKLDNPDKQISVKTLYRHYKAIQEDDLEGLVDSRGKHSKGTSTVTEEMWGAFLFYYLDEAQHSITKCYEYMQMAVRDRYPQLYTEIPSIASFRRKLNAALAPQVEALGRKGEKAYRDNYGLFIRREYDTMHSNDYWIGDTHTLDVQSMDEKGTIHRLYLSAWMDARSGIFVGWNIATSSSSQNTLLALRHGIIRHGIPYNVYVDNGREFLNHDIGGMGHRKRKPKSCAETHEPPPIFARLGITMTNAIVKNARAKIIERRFRDFKEQISKIFPTYTGGNIMERPECLKARVKNGEVVIDNQLIEEVSMLIEFNLNYEAYNGAVTSDHGKRKIDVYNEYLEVKRTSSYEELDLMLMRSSRMQTYGRRGVHLDIGGERFDYMSEPLRAAVTGKKVYYRYDPNNLATVRVYDENDTYLGIAECDDKLVNKYGADKDSIKEAQSVIRKAERTDKDALQAVRALGFKTVRELTLAKAYENSVTPASEGRPKVISLHRAVEQPIFKQAVGSDIDLDKMIRNAEKSNQISP